MRKILIVLWITISILCIINVCAAFDKVTPDNDNFVKIDRNFNQFFYKRVQVPPNTQNYIFHDTVEVTYNTTLCATSNTAGATLECVLCGQGTFEIRLGASYSITTEVSVIGVNQDASINE